MAADGRLPLDKLSGAGAAVGDTLVWTGTRWAPGATSGSGLAIVDDAEPADPETGQLWFDTDDSC